MNLKKMGEFGFIDSFANSFDKLISENMEGIGDDCAVFSAGDKQDYVVSTDLLLEDTHFLLSKIGYYRLGQKALAVNLSDLAAMGAAPFASFLSLGVPQNTSGEDLAEFMAGYQDLSQRHNIPLLGGDTTGSCDKLVVNVCVVGKVVKGKAKLRSAGKAGDLVCVSGFLGDSAGGLQVLLQNIPPEKDEKALLKAHHRVTPQIKIGLFLGKQAGVHAMIDISDGIASDLTHIIEKSNLGALIEISDIPISPALQKVCTAQGWSALELAVAGGEDYQLLFTVDPEKLAELQAAYQQKFGEKFFVVGKLTANQSKIVWTKDSKTYHWQPQGFDHFK